RPSLISTSVPIAQLMSFCVQRHPSHSCRGYLQQTASRIREGPLYFRPQGRDFVALSFFSKERRMGSKPTSRRELLKGGAALAGGLAALGQTPALGQAEHDHAAGQAAEPINPMIMGTKELIEYGQRSRFVTSVRIAHPIGGRPSPDAFGKV